MKKAGILYHPLKKAALPLAEKTATFLKSKGLSVWTASAWEVEEARNQLNGTDMVLSIGGDGTILRAAQVVVPEPVPIIGINLGNLGFMTELGVDEAESGLTRMLNGEGRIDERSLLVAELEPGPDDDQAPGTFYALNDVVMAHGGVARVVYIEASIDGEPLTSYKADGVIVATATGSTGYSLSAGGPIMHPQARELLLTPISPHISSSYSVVLPSTAVVKLDLKIAQTATLSVDGHINLPLSSGAVVRVKHSPNTVRFLRVHPDMSFYGTLEQRLKGKQ